MIRRLAAPAALVLSCLAGCHDPAEAPQAPAPAAVEAPAPTPPTDESPAAEDHAAPTAAVEPAPPAAPGAPAYAALYPGAELDAPATIATGEAGDGGLVTFQIDATPDQVVDFYRERAEQAGLRSVMGLNQGDARAYGAAGDAAEGPKVQVVAAPGEGGRTSVQLSWSEGQ